MAAELSQEEASKDLFFKKLADLSTEMINEHGKDFTMGALMLAARFIAENKPFERSPQANEDDHDPH
ncbi:MAG: hypothetical protein ACR2P3_14780 [Geminicoccaceae bacterium]